MPDAGSTSDKRDDGSFLGDEGDTPRLSTCPSPNDCSACQGHAIIKAHCRWRLPPCCRGPRPPGPCLGVVISPRRQASCGAGGTTRRSARTLGRATENGRFAVFLSPELDCTGGFCSEVPVPNGEKEKDGVLAPLMGRRHTFPPVRPVVVPLLHPTDGGTVACNGRRTKRHRCGDPLPTVSERGTARP